MWEVMCNNKSIGIIETNYDWASKYWSSKCSKKNKYSLIEK